MTRRLQKVDPESHGKYSGDHLDENRRIWSTSGPRRLADLAVEFRASQATKPVDKIYGLLGMSAEASHPMLKPDYNMPPQRVYRTATRFIIEQDQRLDILCVATGTKSLANLPSWTPDFTVPGYENAVPLKVDWNKLQLYSAAKDLAMEVSFSEESDVMYADGVRAGSIQCLAASGLDQKHEFDDFVEYLVRDIQTAWSDLAGPLKDLIAAKYGPQFSLEIALNKMLSADRVPWLPLRPKGLNSLTRAEPEKSWLDLSLQPPEVYLGLGQREDGLSLWQECKMRLVKSALGQRRFTITENGYIGLVPELTEAGDLVCVLFGCDTPVVLRPVESHFILIGECYIHGLMDGELVDQLEAGQATRERFQIR